MFSRHEVSADGSCHTIETVCFIFSFIVYEMCIFRSCITTPGRDVFFYYYYVAGEKPWHMYTQFKNNLGSIFSTGFPVFNSDSAAKISCFFVKKTKITQICSFIHQIVYKNTVAKYILYKIKFVMTGFFFYYCCSTKQDMMLKVRLKCKHTV